jgi:hypothetical protein
MELREPMRETRCCDVADFKGKREFSQIAKFKSAYYIV